VQFCTIKKPNKRAKLALPKNGVSKPGKVTIHKLPTGAGGLDEILGGGIPEFSFNIIAGAPGCGKTTLAHQTVFANATPKKPALYLPSSASPSSRCCAISSSFLSLTNPNWAKPSASSTCGVAARLAAPA
jgi:predicted ATP-dependent serine protease